MRCRDTGGISWRSPWQELAINYCVCSVSVCVLIVSCLSPRPVYLIPCILVPSDLDLYSRFNHWTFVVTLPTSFHIHFRLINSRRLWSLTFSDVVTLLPFSLVVHSPTWKHGYVRLNQVDIMYTSIAYPISIVNWHGWSFSVATQLSTSHHLLCVQCGGVCVRVLLCLVFMIAVHLGNKAIFAR